MRTLCDGHKVNGAQREVCYVGEGGVAVNCEKTQFSWTPCTNLVESCFISLWIVQVANHNCRTFIITRVQETRRCSICEWGTMLAGICKVGKMWGSEGKVQKQLKLFEFCHCFFSLIAVTRYIFCWLLKGMQKFVHYEQLVTFSREIYLMLYYDL